MDEGHYEWAGGANLGVFSLLEAYLGAELFAFELIAKALAVLAPRTLELMNPEVQQRVHIVPCVLGAEERIAEFTVLADKRVGGFRWCGRKV